MEASALTILVRLVDPLKPNPIHVLVLGREERGGEGRGREGMGGEEIRGEGRGREERGGEGRGGERKGCEGKR